MPRMFDVRDYGAAGDGVTLDTGAIQKAIDACSAAGGGTVFVGAGKYVIRSIYLHSDMTLYLESGAALIADPHPGIGVFDDGLIVIRNCRDVTICGEGCVNGNDRVFWEPKPENEWDSPIRYVSLRERPRPMLILPEDSEYVRVRDISIAASPVYAVHAKRCEHLEFTSVRVRNDVTGPNADGFHFSSCNHVTVANCSFVCGDDCIAIDSCSGGNARFYTVTGCDFVSACNAFRIFTGIDHREDKTYRADVSDIAASGCTADAMGVFNVSAERGSIKRIRMSDFAVNTAPDRRGSLAFLFTDDGGEICDCAFLNVSGLHNGAVTVTGEELPDGGKSIHDVLFADWNAEIVPEEKKYGVDLPDPLGNLYWADHLAPYGIYLRLCRDVEFRDFNVTWDTSHIKEAFPRVKEDRCENIRYNRFISRDV